MKKKLLVCTVAAMLVFAGCEKEQMLISTETDEEETELTDTNTEELADHTEQPYQVDMAEYRKDEQCDISYPQISGWQNEAKEQEWNAKFLQMAESAVQDLGDKDAVTVTFSIEEQTEDLLSVTVTSYYDFDGAAHPSSSMQSVNINMQTGEKVTFSDMADPAETAQLLMNGTEGYTLLGGDELTMQDILEYNFIWMEPSEEALERSLEHFDGELSDYGENETMGYSFRRNGKVCLIFYVNHAMGDYAVVQLEE